MRITLLAVTLVALASDLGAQSTNTREYSLIYGRRIAKDSLVKAIRECNKVVLRPPCAEIAVTAKRLFPTTFSDSGVTDVELADYVAGLEERPCQAGGRIIATEWVPPSVSPTGEGLLILASHDMGCTANEVLLWDKDEKRPVISLYDGNFVAKYTAPATQVTQASVAPTVQRPRTVTPTRSVVQQKPDTPRTRTVSSDIRVPVGGKDVRARVDTVFRTRYDTVTKTVVETVVRVDTVYVKSGFPVWRTLGVIGAIVGGTVAYCHFEGCGDITNINRNNNGMSSGPPAMRRGISIRIPFP